jgi:hypothetical protein
MRPGEIILWLNAASAMASFDVQDFEGLSWPLTEIEAALMFLRGRIERHESKTDHNTGVLSNQPCSKPMGRFSTYGWDR